MKPYLIISLFNFIVGFGVFTQAAGLDVNDVSFLFPIKLSRPYPELQLDSVGLIGESHFQQIIKFEHPTLNMSDLPYVDAHHLQSRSNWFVTGMRFDPCGEVFVVGELKQRPGHQPTLLVKRGPGCQPRIRLVVQPLNLLGQPLPSALHLLFKLRPSAVVQTIRALRNFKARSESKGLATTGLPLMVHPALQRESVSSSTDLAELLKSSILALTRASDLEIVTLTLRADLNHWKMVGGYISGNKWTRFVSEFSSQIYENQEGNAGIEDINCDQLSICSFKPSALKPQVGTIDEIFRPENLTEQIPGRRSHEISLKAENIDDPARTHFFNTNCISCHQSSNLRDRNQLIGGSESRLTVTPFVPKKLTSELTNNVINFGYFGTIARVSTRTAAESVAVAETVNRYLKVEGPASPISNLNRFWKCLMNEFNYQVCLTDRSKEAL